MPLRPNPAEAVDDGGGEPDTAHNFRVRIRSAWHGGAEVNKTAYRCVGRLNSLRVWGLRQSSPGQKLMTYRALIRSDPECWPANPYDPVPSLIKCVNTHSTFGKRAPCRCRLRSGWSVCDSGPAVKVS